MKLVYVNIIDNTSKVTMHVICLCYNFTLLLSIGHAKITLQLNAVGNRVQDG